MIPTRFVSFGFKHGVPVPDPVDGIVIDVRPLFPSNPWRAVPFRRLTGLDPDVQTWIKGQTGYVQRLQDLINRIRLAPPVSAAGTVYLGCTGGRHRSVYLAHYLAGFYQVPVEHVHIHASTITR